MRGSRESGRWLRRIGAVGLLVVTSVATGSPSEVEAWTPSDINVALNQSGVTWRIKDLDIGPDGSIVNVGDTEPGSDFDPSTSVTRILEPISGNFDGHVQKLDRYGNYVWAGRFADVTQGGRRSSSADAVSVDSAGNIYIAGSFGGTVDFDPTSGTAVRVTTLSTFLLSLTADGNFRWVTVLPSRLTHNAVHVNDRGAVTVVGTVSTESRSWSVDFDPSDVGGSGVKTGDTTRWATDIFVAQYSAATGAYRWASVYGAADYDSAQAVTSDSQGNVIVTGYFGDVVDFDSSSDGGSLSAEDPNSTCNSCRDGFVLKLSGDGAYRWVHEVDSQYGSGEIRGVVVGANDNIHIVGQSDGITYFESTRGVGEFTAFGGNDPYAASFTSAGAFRWVRNFGPGAGGYNEGNAIDIDADGRIAVVGQMSGTVRMNPGENGTPVELTASERGGFFVRFEDDGTFVQARKIGGASVFDSLHDIAADSRGNLYVAGWHDNSTNLDTDGGSATFSRSRGETFVVRVDSAGSTRTKVPQAPTSPVATTANGDITVTWGEPRDDGGSPVSAYSVVAQPSGVTCSTVGAVRTCDLSGVETGIEQSITIVATNAKGSSAASTTVLATVPGLPRAPITVAGSAGDRRVEVSWTAPTNTGGSPITRYRVTANPGGKTCETTGATQCVVGDLINGREYTFTVVATTVRGNSAPSDPSDPVTPYRLPSAPFDVVATAGNASAVVEWEPSADGGGYEIAGYIVTANPGGEVCETTTETQCAVSGLTNGQEYTFTVVATTVRGDSAPSEPSDPVTPFTNPSSPFDVVATAGDASAVVEWEPSADGGGVAVTRYTAVASPGGQTCTVEAPATRCKVSSLENGTTYTFVVVAATRFATSEKSDRSNEVTPLAVPDAPFGVVAQAADSSTVVSWKEPRRNGGSAVVSYRAVTNPGGRSCSVEAPTLTCTIDGLANGTSYTVVVTALNRVGESNGSSPVTVVPGRPPSAPRDLRAVNDDGTIRLTWAHPGDLGGRLLQRYRLEVVRDDSDPIYREIVSRPWVDITDPETEVPAFVVSDLRPGSTYKFRLRGVNFLGSGDWSEAASVVFVVPPKTDFSMPGEVRPLTYVTFAVPNNNLEWLEVSSRSGACAVHKASKWWEPGEPDSTAVLFLRPGRCLVQAYRFTGSVPGAVVSSFTVEVSRDAPSQRRLRPMITVPMKFHEGGGPRGLQLMPGSQEALDNATPAWYFRPMYGPVHLMCDEGTFVSPSRDTDATKLAKRRCGAARQAVSTAVGRTMVFDIRESFFVDEPDTARMVLAAVAPIVDPPSAPENLRIVADNYSATVTWDPPAETYGSSSVSYRLTYRLNRDEPVTVVSTTLRRHEIAVSKRTQVDIGQPVLVSVVAITAQGGRGGAALAEFTFKHRRTVASIDVARVRTGTWIKAVETRGSPWASLYVRSLTPGVVTCLEVRQIYVVFLAPGRCEVNVNQADPDTWMRSVDSRVVTVSDSAFLGHEVPFEEYRVEFAPDGVTITDEAALREATRDALGTHLYFPAECQRAKQLPICRRTQTVESFLQRLPRRSDLVVSTPPETWNRPGGNVVVLHIIRPTD